MHHHKSRHRPPVPGSARRGAAHPELTFPNPVTRSSPHSAQPGQKLKTPPSTTATSYPSATRRPARPPCHPRQPNHQLQRAANPGNSPSTHPSTAASSNCPARPSQLFLQKPAAPSHPAPRTRRPRRPEPSQRNQDHVSFGLVGRVVLPHDVGADPAALGDLQASRPGPVGLEYTIVAVTCFFS
jgi:hypothetical protein